MKGWLKYIIGIILLLCVGILGYFIGQKNRIIYLIGSKNMSALDKLEATLDLVDRYYVDSVDQEYLVSKLIPSLMSQLDPHSTYLTKEEREAESESMGGAFFGIGVTFNYLLDTIAILDVIPGGPSDIAGIKAGDRITKVDGVSYEGLKISADSIRSRLKGSDGSFVKLTLRDPESGKIRDVNVKRGAVTVSTVEASYLRKDSLGVIKLSQFGNNTYSDFMTAYARLSQMGAKGYVLDLRGNPGGVMEAALRMTNEMLPAQSLIMYMEGKSFPREDFKSDGTGSLVGVPLYVLIDELSASASEIVTGALQDNDAAIVLGRRSFGKGLVQKLFEYKDGSSIHLTIARYYTPSGRSIQRSYTLGDDEAYNQDWINRYSGGELFNRDSIHFDPKLLYHTVGDRPVYGGGGIMPDIFVPQDTVGLNSYSSQIFSAGVLPAYSFYYADKYRKLLKRLQSTDDAIAFLKRQNLVWRMADYANSKYGIRIRSYLVNQSKPQLERLLISAILSYTYGRDVSEEFMSRQDPVMEVASELFSSGIYDPMEIPEDRVLLSDEVVNNSTDSLHINSDAD